MKYRTKLTFKIFKEHSFRYKFSLFGILFFILLGDVFKTVGPYLYKILIDKLAAGAVPQDLFILLGYIFLAASVHHVSIRVALYFGSYFQTSVMRDLAGTCFRYLHKHSFTFFNNNFVGSLVKRVNRFSRAFSGIADKIIWDLYPIVLNILFIIVVLSFRSVLFGLIIFGWVILYSVINYIFSLYKLKYDIERSELDSKVTGVLADTVTNHSNLKLFVGYDREVSRFDDLTRKLSNLRRFTWDISTHFEVVQGFLMIILEIVMIYIAILLWEKGVLTVGDFVLVQTYLFTIFHKLWGFGRVIRDFYEHLADAEEMTEIFDTPFEITDIRRAKDLIVKNGKIEFQHVNFNYHKTRRVIDNLDFTISAGEKVAFVGPSGAGKSTIVKLLLRQHNVTSGKILIDGQRISRVTQNSLREHLSLVPQDPILFHREIIENVRYGKLDATDQEVLVATKAAHAHEFISQFPEGYNTYVGERGVKLSGGERQRVAIARAILKNSPILVLDEATSSLDSESELLIQDALDTLMKKKTVIVIAHRLSTIMKMDRILVVDDGKIIESGTHKELLKKKGGMYRKLWELQAGGFLN